MYSVRLYSQAWRLLKLLTVSSVKHIYIHTFGYDRIYRNIQSRSRKSLLMGLLIQNCITLCVYVFTIATTTTIKPEKPGKVNSFFVLMFSLAVGVVAVSLIAAIIYVISKDRGMAKNKKKTREHKDAKPEPDQSVNPAQKYVLLFLSLYLFLYLLFIIFLKLFFTYSLCLRLLRNFLFFILF